MSTGGLIVARAAMKPLAIAIFCEPTSPVSRITLVIGFAFQLA